MKQIAVARNRKGIVILLCALALFIGMPVCVSAAGSNGKGAKLPAYKQVKKVQVDKEDFQRSLQNALEIAGRKASNSCQYKIVIPPGKYVLSHVLTIKSNIWIYAKGAKITIADHVSRVMATEPNKTYQNVRIEGGVWDASSQTGSKEKREMMLRFSHVKNMVLSGMTLKCKRNNHIVEVSDMNGFTVKNCKISGNSRYLQVQPKEALQLDAATKEAMVNCTPYNGKGCHNVLITGNTFSDVSRGVGSHSYAKGAEKNPYTNITVEKNTFKGCKGEAIYFLYWKNCSVLKNKIYNAKHAGIYMQDSTLNKVQNNTIAGIGAYSGERAKTYGSDRAGVLMRNISRSHVIGNQASGCKKAVMENPAGKRNVIKRNKKLR